MKDVLIPLGLLLFIGFFAYAVIHTARKQRKAKAGVFRDFANKTGLRYQKEDDGKAQGFAREFDGIGRFSSPSLGKVIPKDVVDGIMNESETILFRHSIRFSEGWAREWFVAGVTCAEPIAERCAIQFCKVRGDKNTMYLQDSVVKEQKVGSFNSCQGSEFRLRRQDGRRWCFAEIGQSCRGAALPAGNPGTGESYSRLPCRSERDG